MPHNPTKTNPNGKTRRQFIKTTASCALTLGVTAILSTHLPSTLSLSAEPPKTARRLGLVIDTGKCIGCGLCVAACRRENQLPPEEYWNRVEKATSLPGISSHQYFITINCQHCNNPPCVNVCPTGASYKRGEDGVVLIDYAKCIGCRYCIVACPYGVRRYREDLGIVRKCTLCIHRITEGLEPACVPVCPVNARNFGDLADPNSVVSRLINENYSFILLPQMGTEPSVVYLHTRR